jgi:hypothetical protein
MSFAKAKRQVIEAIQSKHFRHEGRSEEYKNLLATGEVDHEEAIRILGKTRGHEASKSRHHFDSDLEVWIFRPAGWYIKFYMLKDCWFISFHRSEAAP